MLTKLTKTLIPVLDQHNLRIIAWTDSTVVLHWLNSEPNRWKCFVANRISIIQRELPQALWRHVPSLHNPADCASRGLHPPDLLYNSSWWNGPSWLCQSEDAWPNTPELKKPDSISNEFKAQVTSIFVAVKSSWELLNKFSSLDRLCRTTAYCQRFLNNSRIQISAQRQTGPLTYPEILTGLDA